MTASQESPGDSLGILGLGVMGRSLALHAAEKGWSVLGWDPDRATREKLTNLGGRKLRVAPSLRAWTRGLRRPARILLMVPAGLWVDRALEALRPWLRPGDALADGGNSHYKDTERRASFFEKRGVRYLGLGVSGGESGARRGAAMMGGGSKKAWATFAPILDSLSARGPAGPCCVHVGPGGSGHFVKMVHNGIEYADLQILAEAYVLLRAGGLGAAECARVFENWNRGPLESFLTGLSARVLSLEDPSSSRALVDGIRDEAGQKGSGGWCAIAALEYGIAFPALFAALGSRMQKPVKGFFNKRSTRRKGVSPAWAQALGQAVLSARILAYERGFSLIQSASKDHRWAVKPRDVLRAWSGGCIIRGWVPERMRLRLPVPPPLEKDLAEVLRFALREDVPTPALAGTRAFLQGARGRPRGLNLVGALRDAFGAHGYRIRGAEGLRHREW